MKMWIDILELVTRVLIPFVVIIGAALLAGYLLGRWLGVS